MVYFKDKMNIINYEPDEDDGSEINDYNLDIKKTNIFPKIK